MRIFRRKPRPCCNDNCTYDHYIKLVRGKTRHYHFFGGL